MLGSHDRRQIANVPERTPADLSAPRSHSSDMITKTTRNDSPLHFTPQASPSMMPPTSRQGRGPIVGTPLRASPPSARNRPSRSRNLSRSTTRAPKPARMNVSRKMSSSAIRDSTIETPSMIISDPAMAPIRFERNIRRAIRTVMNTHAVPAIAGAIRQPSSLLPKK